MTVRSAGRKRNAFALAALAVCLHVVLYASSFRNTFTFDDRKIVLDGAEVNGRAPLAGVLVRPYFPKPRESMGIDYRPVTLFVLGLEARLFAVSPGAMRLANVVVAGLGAGLFGLLVVELGAPLPAAAAVVLVLSCHAVRSE